ncbi:Os07g0516451 [Oryza sativa Japonica Group]|nr:Os07g0516451 [Oryza sativa Japonica Group]
MSSDSLPPSPSPSLEHRHDGGVLRPCRLRLPSGRRTAALLRSGTAASSSSERRRRSPGTMEVCSAPATASPRATALLHSGTAAALSLCVRLLGHC